MITSTLSSYPNKRIVQQLGIVSAFDDKLRAMRVNVELPIYIENAIKLLTNEAEKLGANAVLGITFSVSERTLPLVIGTAVILEDE